MKKLLTLAVALFVGATAAQTIPMAPSEHTVMAMTATKDLLNFGTALQSQWGYSFDLQYTTEYQGGPYTNSDAPNEGFQYEQYGLFLQSTADVWVTATFFDKYQQTMRFKGRPFRFSPYTQWFIWYRPERSGDNFDLNIYASTWLEVLTMKTKVTQKTKTCKISIYDYVKDSATNNIVPQEATDCSYNTDYDVDYTDPYWKVDAGKKILGDDFVSRWYGEQKIFNWWVLDNYSW